MMRIRCTCFTHTSEADPNCKYCHGEGWLPMDPPAPPADREFRQGYTRNDGWLLLAAVFIIGLAILYFTREPEPMAGGWWLIEYTDGSTEELEKSFVRLNGRDPTVNQAGCIMLRGGTVAHRCGVRRLVHFKD